MPTSELPARTTKVVNGAGSAVSGLLLLPKTAACAGSATCATFSSVRVTPNTAGLFGVGVGVGLLFEGVSGFGSSGFSALRAWVPRAS